MSAGIYRLYILLVYLCNSFFSGYLGLGSRQPLWVWDCAVWSVAQQPYCLALPDPPNRQKREKEKVVPKPNRTAEDKRKAPTTKDRLNPPQKRKYPTTPRTQPKRIRTPQRLSPRDVRWSKFVGTGKERNAFRLKKIFLFPVFFVFSLS